MGSMGNLISQATSQAELTNLLEMDKFGMISATSYGAVGDGVTDDTTNIDNVIDAIDDGTVVYFPYGTYLYSSNLEIANKDNFTIICAPGTKFYDACQSVALLAGGTTKKPVGITFNTCTNFEVINMTLDGDVGTYAELATASEASVVPHIDFVDCTNYKVVNLKMSGNVGGYFGNSARLDSLADAPAYFMRWGYMRHWGGKNVTVDNCEIVAGATSADGEYFQFFDCEDVKFLNNWYYQGAYTSTFDSFAKIISCDDVSINGINIESDSAGSTIEFSGNNITVENCNFDTDTTAGDLAISSQWGALTGTSSNVTIKNCHTTSPKLLSCPTSGTAPFNTTIDNLVVENCYDAGYTVVTASTGDIPLQYIKDYIVKNKTYTNVARIGENETTVAYDNDYIRNATFKDCKIETNKAIFGTVSIVEGFKGQTLFEGGEISLGGYNEFMLLDRYLAFASAICTASDTTFVFKNVSFSNCIVDVRANVKFETCSFYNVYFKSPTTIVPKIEFEDCKFKYGIVPATPLSALIFNLLSYSELHFINCKISGKHKNAGNYVLGGALDYAGNIYITGGNIDLIRYVSDISEVNSVLVGIPNATIGANVYLNSVEFGTNQTVVSFSGATDAGAKVNFYMKNCNLKATTSISMSGTSYDRVDAVIQSNIAVGSEITDLVAAAANFNTFRHDANL